MNPSNGTNNGDFSSDEEEHEVMPGVYVTHFGKKGKKAVSEIDAFQSALKADVDDFMRLLQGLSIHEQVVQVQFLIDQIKHQISHLEFSQDQIRLFLQSDPGDKDLQEAITENEPVLERMRQKLSRMESYLHGLHKQGGCAALGPVSAPAAAPPTSAAENQDASDEKAADDAGMWL